MPVRLGAKIRELRKSRNISQEVLAQYLGVSFQAVSKWENDVAMPDVALLPVLAAFFNVSTDALFDYNRLDAEQKVDAICEEAYQHRYRDPARSEAILREGLRQYPGNDVILNNLLYTMSAPERADEMITLCKTLIASTHDDEVRYDALRILAETYHTVGQQALVAPTLEEIPEIYFTKLELMAKLLDGALSEKAARQQLAISMDDTIDMLLIIRDHLLSKGIPDEADKYARIAKGVIEAFRREDGEAFNNAPVYSCMREHCADLA